MPIIVDPKFTSKDGALTAHAKGKPSTAKARQVVVRYTMALHRAGAGHLTESRCRPGKEGWQEGRGVNCFAKRVLT
jgi:hypothetical protein